MIGPIAPPAPANPAHIAIALKRSRGGKTTLMIESVAGMMNAAPLPMMARPTITWNAVEARAATTVSDGEHNQTCLQCTSATEFVA